MDDYINCQHRNGNFSEYAIIENCKVVKDGALAPIGDNNVGNITFYKFVCSDCGRAWQFKGRPKSKFLQRIYDQL